MDIFLINFIMLRNAKELAESLQHYEIISYEEIKNLL